MEKQFAPENRGPRSPSDLHDFVGDDFREGVVRWTGEPQPERFHKHPAMRRIYRAFTFSLGDQF